MKLNSPSFHSRLEAKWQMSGPHRDAWAGAGQPGARQACHYVPGMGVSGDTTTDSCAHITAIPQWKIGETSLPTAHSQTEPPLCLPQTVEVMKEVTNKTCVNFTSGPILCPLSQRVAAHHSPLRASSGFEL